MQEEAYVAQAGQLIASRDRRASFVRLAEKRVANALRAIRLISNLSNRSHYDFSEKDVRKVVAALTAELSAMEQKFAGSTRRGIEFKL